MTDDSFLKSHFSHAKSILDENARKRCQAKKTPGSGNIVSDGWKGSFQSLQASLPLNGNNASAEREQQPFIRRKPPPGWGRGSCCLFGISCLLFKLQPQRGLLIPCSCCCGPS